MIGPAVAGDRRPVPRPLVLAQMKFTPGTRARLRARPAGTAQGGRRRIRPRPRRESRVGPRSLATAYLGLRERPSEALLLPLRPACMIVLLVRLTASRSA